MSFDLAARTWDNDKRAERANRIAAEIGRHIPEGRKSAMEFGCGTGLLSFFLADTFDEITLIDSSRGMIEVLTEKISGAAVKNMVPLWIDLTDEEYAGKKFDALYSSMAYHHVRDTERITAILFDLLSDGGCACIVDLDEEDGSFHSNKPFYDGHNGFDREALCRIFSEAGFINVSASTFYHSTKEIGDRQIPYSLFLLYAEKPA